MHHSFCLKMFFSQCLSTPGLIHPGNRVALDQWKSLCCQTSLTKLLKTMESTWRTRDTHWGAFIAIGNTLVIVTLRLLRSEQRMVGGTAVRLSSACFTGNERLWVTFDGSAGWPSTMCESLSGDFSSLMTKASWGRSPWTISQWADLWTRLCGWCRPSSTLTNTEKVREGLFVLFNIIVFNAQAYIHGGSKFFFISKCVYVKKHVCSNSEMRRNWWMLLCIFCSVPSRMEARQWHSEYPWNQTLIQTLD